MTTGHQTVDRDQLRSSGGICPWVWGDVSESWAATV